MSGAVVEKFSTHLPSSALSWSFIVFEGCCGAPVFLFVLGLVGRRKGRRKKNRGTLLRRLSRSFTWYFCFRHIGQNLVVGTVNYDLGTLVLWMKLGFCYLMSKSKWSWGGNHETLLCSCILNSSCCQYSYIDTWRHTKNILPLYEDLFWERWKHT